MVGAPAMTSSIEPRRSRWSNTAIFLGVVLTAFVIMAFLVSTTSLNQYVWLRIFFGISALNFMLRASIPLILGALSGILCERTGIVNIGIEGMMLAGASRLS